MTDKLNVGLKPCLDDIKLSIIEDNIDSFNGIITVYFEGPTRIWQEFEDHRFSVIFLLCKNKNKNKNKNLVIRAF